MARRVVVVTGAAGFLGSAITRDLARDHEVVAIDRRTPDPALRDSTPRVDWQQLDIADGEALSAALSAARSTGRSTGLGAAHAPAQEIAALIHLAAYYDFDTEWRAEYQRTNVDGTERVVEAAIASGVRRLIFASSMMAMQPAPAGAALSERSPTSEALPYGKSKAIGERIVREAQGRLPAVTLRIGGVFSDWCELPPLYGLIEMWTGRPPLNRVLVGQGRTGIPYLHRDDLVRLVRRCLEREESLATHEVLLASQHGAVSHRELFEAIRGAGVRSVPVPGGCARAGLRLQRALGRLTGRMPFERPWMLDYADRPWVADTTTTREKLGWDCSPRLELRARLPRLLENLRGDRSGWELRKRGRLERDYRMQPSEVLGDG